MERKDTNRAHQLSIEKQYQKGVALIDIDTAISNYMKDHIIPTVQENGKTVVVPLIYGNAERWEGARKQGYLRDQRCKIQIPLVMFKRNSIERDQSLQHFREVLRMPAYKKYTAKNRYDRFSAMTASRSIIEQYEVAIPAYVTVTYEVMIWTSFTEHMNKIVEAFQYATDRYWGDIDGYKFRTRIDSFDNQQEVGQGSERVIRTTFTMAVNAYLLPETFDNQPVVKKELSAKKVVFSIETDLSGNLLSNPTSYGEYETVMEFIAIRGAKEAIYMDIARVKLTGVELPVLPSELIGTFDTEHWFSIYINGNLISPIYYTYTYNATVNEITFNFIDLPYAINGPDTIYITGKFIEI